MYYLSFNLVDFLNGKCSELITWLYGLLLNFNGLLQLAILVGITIFAVIGIITFVKKTTKLAIVLGLIAVIALSIWTILTTIL